MADRGVVLTNAAGERQFFYDEQVAAALDAGWAPAGDQVVESDLTGGRAVLTGEQYSKAIANDPGSLHGPDVEAERALQVQRQGEARYGGLGQGLLAAGEGAAGALTLGLSDLALDKLGADTAERAKFSDGRIVGEIAGTAATILSPFGKGSIAKVLGATPAGAVAKFGAGGSSALARVAHTAGEGIAYGVGQALSNVALAEPGITAEQVVSELGQGALLGAALGAGGGLLGEGVRAVSKLRPAKSAVLDLEHGAAKEALEGLAEAHRTIDDFAAIAQAQGRKHAAEVRATINAEQAMAGIDPSKLGVEFAASIDDAVKAVRPPAPKKAAARAVFDLADGEKITPAAFKRLLKKEPNELYKRAVKLDEYYASALATAKGNEVATTRIREAMGAYGEALGKIMEPEAVAAMSDPKVLLSLLGVEAGAEVVLPEGPAKDFLQLAAAYKLMGGVAGLKGSTRSLGRRVANAIGKRAAAGLGSGLVRTSPVVSGLGPALGTAAVGAGASAGYESYGVVQRWLSGRGQQSALVSHGAVQVKIGAAVERVAAGKPTRARAMPTTNAILDRLLGEEPGKRTPAEKYAVIQDRLAKFSVAPDAALESIYQLLKPVQEVSEQLADLMETVLSVQLPYLTSKMPRDTGTMMMFGKSMWQPTDRDLYEFAMHAVGVIMPLEAVDMIADGVVPPQAAEALAATNPEIFAKFQHSIIEHADDIRANSTYNQRISLGLAFQLPLDPTTDPRYVAFVQQMHAQKTMQQAAGSSGEGSTPQESYSDAQKLLS